MRKRMFSIILSLCFVLLFTPSIIFAPDMDCDIGVHVLDIADSTAVEDVRVFCWSYDELEGKSQYTEGDGWTLFAINNWPNPPPCSNNYGDYAICLPNYWEEEDINCQGVPCTVTFYIDPGSPYSPPKCLLACK